MVGMTATFIGGHDLPPFFEVTGKTGARGFLQYRLGTSAQHNESRAG